MKAPNEFYDVMTLEDVYTYYEFEKTDATIIAGL